MVVSVRCRHDTAAVPHVLGRMGRLYTSGTVLPLYFKDFSAAVELPTNPPADADPSESGGPVAVAPEAAVDEVFEALRRGWIQQEVRFGALSRTAVDPFVRDCLMTRQFGLLGSVLRRRPSAMSWLCEAVQLEPNYADMADAHRANSQLDQLRAERLLGIQTTASPQSGEESNVAAAIRSWLLSHLDELSPAADQEF
jgi:hypothetical protein